MNWYSTGNVYARGTLLASSDRRLKENIKPIENALQSLDSLEGVYFNWKDTSREGRQIGLIAQDVEKAFPEVVSEDQDGFKAVSYAALIAPVINAIKELKSENRDLRARVEALEQGE